jgi:hypothetical protein
LNTYIAFVHNLNTREEIVKIVSSFCKNNNLDYRTTWNLIYEAYGEKYHIWPALQYKFGHKDKMEFLEAYENLYGTLTKMYELIKEIK